MSDQGSEPIARGAPPPVTPPNGRVDEVSELTLPTGDDPREAASAGFSPSPDRFFRSIGEAVRLATAPGDIDAAYRVTSVSRSRDRELWVVESRFGPR